jgi:glycosyltransferase involved in cell wall biosynthesis
MTKKKSFKIGHLISGPLDAGAAQAVLMLASQLNLNSDKYDNILITTDQIINIPKILIKRNEVTNFFIRVASSIERRSLNYRTKNNYFYSSGFLGFDKSVEEAMKDVDIVHLHWIPGIISLKQILKIDKPVVYTLRDMWPYTGGCHYANQCDKYLIDCNKCSAFSSESDWYSTRISSKQHNLKKQFLNKDNVWICGISDWISNQLKECKWMTNEKIMVIQNGVDFSLFTHFEKMHARKCLQIEHAGFLIGFCAQDISDPVKGLQDVIEDFSGFEDKYLKLLTFGNNSRNLRHGNIIKHIPFSTKHEVKSYFYSSLDLLIVPSRMEAFGKVAIEAMHFGVPALTFDDIGTAGLIVNSESGFLANRLTGMKNALKEIISIVPSDMSEIRNNSIARASQFNINKCANNYISLYDKMLNI